MKTAVRHVLAAMVAGSLLSSCGGAGGATEKVASETNVTLDIELTGLIALVRENCKLGKTKAVHAILMNDPEMPHAPRLLVDSDYAEPPNHPDEIISLGKKQYLVWDLSRHRLVVPKPPSIAIKERKIPDRLKPPPNQDISEGYDWMAQLDRSCKVDPKEQDIDKDTVNEKVLPDYASARLMRLEVDDTQKDNLLKARFYRDLPKERIYTFGDNTLPTKPDDYVQALADGATVHLNLKVKDKENLILTLVSYDGKSDEYVRLKTLNNTIMVSNLPVHQEPYNANTDRLRDFARFQVLLPPEQRKTCTTPISIKQDGAAPVKCTLCGSCGPNP